MKINFKISFALIVCLFLLQASIVSFANESLNSFTDAQKNFSISYPLTWKVQNTPIVSLHASLKDQSPLTPNVKVIIQNHGVGMDLKKFVEHSKEIFKKNWEVMKQEEGKLGSIPYMRLTLFQSLDASMKSKNLKYFISVKDTVYVVSFSSSVELFDQNLAVFEKVWSSFKILK